MLTDGCLGQAELVGCPGKTAEVGEYHERA